MRWYRSHPLSEGHPVYLGAAVGLGLLTAILIFPPIHSAARAAAGDPPNQDDITFSVTLTFLFIGVAVGGMGSLLRAVAHNRPELSAKTMDHIGKLLAAFAFVFSFMGTFIRILQLPFGNDYQDIVVGLVVLMMVVALFCRPALRRYEDAQTAAAAERAKAEQQERDVAKQERRATNRRSHLALGLGALALVISTVHARRFARGRGHAVGRTPKAGTGQPASGKNVTAAA